MPTYFEVLGFKRSPFFREPLQPTKEDFKTFVGRTEDIRKFLMNISSTEGVHLVTGKSGVGKTSFVNAIQYITSASPIPIDTTFYKINFFPEKMFPSYRLIPGDQL